ncbi:MAG: WYL domain-containing protein [Pirellulales bacterium]|nr:WYL domain-containing protein [Pirellulales bacterium]
MEASSPLVRQWLLLRTLSVRRYGVTIKELAEDSGVSEKTIRRDLETFQAAGFPLEEIVEEFGRKKWKLECDGDPPDLRLLWDEAAALYLGQRFLEPLAGTPFWEAAQRAFKKIRATLGDGSLKYMQKFAALFHQTMVGASDYSKKSEIVDQLMIGIEDARAVFITYQSLRATEPVTYDVHPYGLAYHRGSLYLVGKHLDKERKRGLAPSVRSTRGAVPADGACPPSCTEEDVCHWKVDRIEDAEVTEVRFQRPDDFNLSEHLGKSFGIFRGDGEVHVKVRFLPPVVRYVEESKWHESQKLAPQRDGSLLAEFDLDGTEEILRWLLSFGRHAEVLEPESLRAEILEETAYIQDNYERKNPQENKISKNKPTSPGSKRQKQSQ